MLAADASIGGEGTLTIARPLIGDNATIAGLKTFRAAENCLARGSVRSSR
jgi:hypothetical protein